jgi:hypothetical protein
MTHIQRYSTTTLLRTGRREGKPCIKVAIDWIFSLNPHINEKDGGDEL